MGPKQLWLLSIATCLLLNCCAFLTSGQGNSGATTVTARVGKDDVQEILENMADGGTLVLEYEDGDVLAGLYNDKSVTVKGQGKTGPILRCPNPCRNCPMFLNEVTGDITIQDFNIESCDTTILGVAAQVADGRVSSHVQILESRFARNTAQAVLFENVAGDASYNVTVDGCLFEENMDAFGYSTKLNMDVIHYEIPTVQILNSKFSRNRAVGKSAVYVTGDLSDAGPSLADHDATNKESAILRVENCTFTRNTASKPDRKSKSNQAAGAAIFAKNLAEVKVVNTEFTKNQVFGRGSKGGAISVDTCRLLNLSSVQFVSNTAEQQGGALAMATVRITTIGFSTFIGNSCNQQKKGRWECLGGGFFWEDHPPGDSELGTLNLKWSITVRNSRFVRNSADQGGAGGTIGRNANGLSTGTLHIIKSYVAKNTAQFAGGGILMRSDSVLRLGNNNFSRNRADRGGAIAVFLGGTVTMKSEAFSLNEAKAAGGALFSSSLKSLSVDSCTFRDSISTDGDGGAVVLDGVQHSIFKDSVFENNAARNGRGGALHFEGRSLIDNVLKVIGTTFTKNQADKSKSKDFTGGLSGGGGALSIIGTENPDKGIFNVTVATSKFKANTAVGGGALLVLTGKSSAFEVLEIHIEDNEFNQNHASEAGGTLLLDEQEGIHLRCTSDSHSKTPLELFQDSFCPDWNESTTTITDVELSLESIGIAPRPFGPIFASLMPSMLQVQPNVSSDNLSGRPIDKLVAIPVDVFGQVMTTTVLGQHIEVEPRSANSQVAFAGQVLAMVENGTAVFTILAAIGDPDTYTVNLTAKVTGQLFLGVVSAPIEVQLRECIAGEVNQPNRLFGCLDCTQGLYSFNPLNETCDPCPANGNCTGEVSVKGQVIRHPLVPVDGYWHSTPFSTQMHQCLSDEACEYTDRVQILQSFQNPFLIPMAQSFNQTIYQQCAEGHHGILCGACDEDYGHSGVGECTKCQPGWVYVLILTGSMGLSLVLVVTTLRGNLVTEKKDSESVVSPSLVTDRDEWSTALRMETTRRKIIRLPSIQDENSQVISNGIRAVEDVEEVKKIQDMAEPMVPLSEEIQQDGGCTDYVEPEPDTPTSPDCAEFREPGEETTENHIEEFGEVPDGLREIETGDPEEENDNPKLKVTELIKIMINFTQVTGTAFLIDFDWPEGIKKMVGFQELFSAASGFWGATECALPSSDRFSKTMSSVILNITTPVMFGVCLVVFWVLRGIHLQKASTINLYKHYLIPRLLVTAWSIIFFYYDSLTESFMKLVYCPSVDEYDTDDRYYQFAISRKRVWAQDTDVTCFRGVHRFLFYGIGVPGLLLITLGVPVALFMFIMFNFTRLQQTKFRTFYGFMYLNYDLEYAFWESAIMVRKALIVAIAVLAHSLGKSLQGVFMLGVIFLALIAHTTTRPLPLDMLDNMETWSLLTTSYTFFAAVVFSDKETSTFIRSVLSITIYLINALFLLHFSYAFLHALREFVITYKHGEEVARELGPHVGFFHKVYYLISAETRMMARRMRNMFSVKDRNRKKSHRSHRTNRV